MRLLQRIVIFFIDRIYCFFFCFYPIKRIYISSTSFKVYVKWTQSKIKSLLFIDVSSPIWKLWRRYSKSFPITSFAFSLIKISMLLLFECIKLSLSLSLVHIKLVTIVNWIFHLSDFLGLFTPFKHSLILLDIIQLIIFYFYHNYFHVQYNYYSKIFYSYWLIIILSFMLKKIPNIPSYSNFNSFIFFFLSKKISYIFNCSVIDLFCF